MTISKSLCSIWKPAPGGNRVLPITCGVSGQRAAARSWRPGPLLLGRSSSMAVCRRRCTAWRCSYIGRGRIRLEGHRHRSTAESTMVRGAAFRAMKHEPAAGRAGRGADRRRRDTAPVSAPPAALHK